MKHTIIFVCAFLFSCMWVFAQPKTTVENIIQGVPEDLSSYTLLVPRYDLMDPENLPEGASPSLMVRFNREAKKGNSTINDLAVSNYTYKFKMASLIDIDSLGQEDEYRYFMDMVLMPKQLKYPEKRAMVPAFDKYPTAIKMFSNRYTQFHYYFYIRDLETNDAYITTKFKGNWDVYNAMKAFFKQLSRDSQ